MRTIYLKSNQKYNWYNPYFYKIVEIDKETTKRLTVTKDNIDLEKSEDFFDDVNFIKNKMHDEEGCEEITRQEFDDFFIETSKKINEITAI